MSSLLLNLFALFTVICAVGTIANKNAVNAAMCFLLCLVGVAGLFIQLDAYLLAFVLLLVYAGAVVALFLFIIMLLDVQGKRAPGLKSFGTVASAAAGALLLVGLYSLATRGQLPAPDPHAATGIGAALKPYAYQLFTTYLLPVQVMGFLLLIAMLGVIVLSKKLAGLEDIK